MIDRILYFLYLKFKNNIELTILGTFLLPFIALTIQILISNQKDKRKTTTQKYREGLIKK